MTLSDTVTIYRHSLLGTITIMINVIQEQFAGTNCDVVESQHNWNKSITSDKFEASMWNYYLRTICNMYEGTLNHMWNHFESDVSSELNSYLRTISYVAQGHHLDRTNI